MTEQATRPELLLAALGDIADGEIDPVDVAQRALTEWYAKHPDYRGGYAVHECPLLPSCYCET